jgi:hypothetical protein
MQPVKVDIKTDEAEQNVASLTKKLKELQEQRKKAIAAGDNDLSKSLLKQINQVKADIKGLGGTTTTTHKTTTAEQIAFDINKAGISSARGVDTMPSIFSMLKDSGAAGINAAMGSIVPDLSADIEKQQTLVDELREKWAKAGGELRDSYVAQIIEAEDKLRNLKDEQEVSTRNTPQFDAKQDISKQWKVGKNGQLTNKPGKDEKQEKTAEEQLQGTQTMISSLQSIVTGINQLGIQLPKELNNIFGVLQTITGIVGAIQTMQTVGTFLGIFAHGGKVPHAASGYFVPGTSRSTDTTPILANAGELVLNESSQDNLALGIRSAESLLNTIDRYQESIMRGSQMSNAASYMPGNNEAAGGSPYITGEIIYMGLSAYLKSSGRGEIVTSRKRG